MIHFESALDIVISHAVRIETLSVTLDKSAGRVLAQDVISCCDLPPFDKSAMDGYACRKDDVLSMGNREGLLLQEVIPAGKVPQMPIKKGVCSKIMTGAPLPEGAEVVVMVEQCEERTIASEANEARSTFVFLADSSQSPASLAEKANICYRGEDVKQGEVVLRKGSLIRPREIAVIAACGLSKILVYRTIKVGIISTGSELVEPFAEGVFDGKSQLPKGKIFNSNSYQLTALVESFGCQSYYYGIAPDSPEITLNLLRRAIAENDIVLLSGGVSEGDFDFVADCIKTIGMEILFDRVAVQPGKPTTFAVGNGKYIFGLPGNPVSAYIQALLLVRPLLVSMQGGNYTEPFFTLPLAYDFKRKNGERLAHIPVKIISDGTCLPIEYHGSAHIGALSEGDALARIPIGVTALSKGEKVQIIVLP